MRGSKKRRVPKSNGRPPEFMTLLIKGGVPGGDAGAAGNERLFAHDWDFG